MEQIDIAVLGIGKMGATHVEAAKASPYVRKIYGYEPDAARATERGGALEIETTSDLDAILNNPAIKFIDIAAPNAVHCELAIKALRAGKAVLCEKPMGETLEDAERLVAVAEETGGFLQLGFELRYSKAYVKLKEWVDNGKIGSPVNLHCRYFCSEFHHKDSWRSNSPGSLIGEKLSHYLDAQRWYMGSEVKEVYSLTAPNVVKYFNHPDNHQINTRFVNGSIATLNFVMYIAESDPSDPLLDVMEKQADDGHFLQLYIMGTEGAMEFDIFKRRLRRWQFSDGELGIESKIVETITYEKAEDTEQMHNVHGQNLRVIELVAKGLPPENPAKDSLMSMKLCFAAERSEKEQRAVSMTEYC